jgi:hypothetical protein
MRACASSKFWPKIVWRAKKPFWFLPFLEIWYALWPGFQGGNLSTVKEKEKGKKSVLDKL